MNREFSVSENLLLTLPDIMCCRVASLCLKK